MDLVGRSRFQPADGCGRAARRRQRISREKRNGGGIHSVFRNNVVGKRPACSRIENFRHETRDSFGENTLALKRRRYRRSADASNSLAASLVIHEKECLVVHDRPAKNESELISAK